jgi:hypothetical protein
MGLDIRIKKVRQKYFNVSEYLDFEVYKNDYLERLFGTYDAKFVAEFRNIWEWKERHIISDEEDNRGRFYRILTCYDEIVNLRNNGFETERLKDIVRGFDFNKFVYIVEFDF